MTAGSSIDYDALTQDALRGVVRAVLIQVAGGKNGLPGEHHFYIAFNTQAPGVVMSRRLKEKYPEEMMIVLQHRFWDLAVTDEAFEVKLTFDGIPERLYVPFEALKVFFDPSVRFTLQFGEAAAGDESQDPATGRRRRPGDEASRQAAERADRRSRTRGRSRDAGADGVQDEALTAAAGAGSGAGNGATSPKHPPAQPSPPAIFSPRSVEPVRAPAAAQPASGAPTPGAPAPSADQPAADAAKPAGAKVFSLDQFRNKK